MTTTQKRAEGQAEPPIITRSDALVVKAIREASREVDFVASTGVVDSHGDVIDQASWQLEEYRSNPVALYGHQAFDLPIGQCTYVAVVNGRLECTIKFSDVTERARDVFKLLMEKTLRAVSVGFRPVHGSYELRDGVEVWVWRNAILKEISVVAIGANPEALAKMKAAIIAGIESAKTIEQPPASPGPNPDAERKAPSMELKDAIAKIETLTASNTKLEVEGKAATDRITAAEKRAEVAEKSATDATAQVKTLSVEKAALEAQTTSLTERAEKAEKTVAELEAKTIDQEVEALVGQKITAAEKGLFVDLRKTNKDLFEKMIAQRAPMKLEDEITAAGKSNGAAKAAGDTSDLLAEFKSAAV